MFKVVGSPFLQQEELPITLSGPQSTFHNQIHARSDKEIMQDEADIEIYKPIITESAHRTRFKCCPHSPPFPATDYSK